MAMAVCAAFAFFITVVPDAKALRREVEVTMTIPDTVDVTELTAKDGFLESAAKTFAAYLSEKAGNGTDFQEDDVKGLRASVLCLISIPFEVVEQHHGSHLGSRNPSRATRLNRCARCRRKTQKSVGFKSNEYESQVKIGGEEGLNTTRRCLADEFGPRPWENGGVLTLDDVGTNVLTWSKPLLHEEDDINTWLGEGSEIKS